MKNHLIMAMALACAVVSSHAQLFTDNFTRGTDPGPLTPWIAQSGTWTVTGGTVQAGLNPTFTYATLYITNNFTNCTVQGRFKFPAPAFGGGLGARLNPGTGTRYVAWLYPDNSPAGGNVLKVLKFSDFVNFGYNGVAFAAVATTNLSSVGTGFHTIRMDLQTNRISVFLDNTPQLVTQDTEAQYYTNGAVSLDMWTDSSPYLMTVDDVLVANNGLAAFSDSFSAVSGLQLSVPAPGVLGNDTGGNAPLLALLATGAAHGPISLNTNGSFTYTGTNGFVGSDSFTYRVTDGVTTSAVATVTIVVSADHPPVANNDLYGAQVNSTLTVPAPGVLANDTDIDGNTLTANLLTGPSNGTLTLTNNGGFTYVPNASFVGSDSFTYRANDGQSNSSAATVSISVQPPGLFSDDFSRDTDPGPLTPWIPQSGTWTVTGGQMIGGLNQTFSYANAHITNIWTDYTSQARFKFPAGSFGGGIGGRMNTTTGARYVAWVYPENSPGGSNVLRLLKFSNFTSFGYNGVDFAPVAAVNLAAVGTNFHTVQLAFQGNHISVYFDSTQVIAVTDTDAQYLTNGTVSLDFWTDAASYLLSVDDVNVYTLARDDYYTASQNTTLHISAPGALANDTEIFGVTQSASLVSGPSHGTLTLTNNGGFTYVPDSNYFGADGFVYESDDGATNLGNATVNLTVKLLNTPPVFLGTPTNRTIVELSSLTVTNPAVDNDFPAQTVSYSISASPAAANITIDANGVINWTPTEAQGPGTYTIRSVATDSFVPPASSTNTFIVTVLETNTPPTLPAQTNRTINELTLMTVNNTATDVDLPANGLTYSLTVTPAVSNPAPAISASGIITWTPSEIQGPGVYLLTTIVNDHGSPAYTATNSFTVTVNEVNSAPTLPAITSKTIAAQTPLTIVNTATDSDVPTNNLIYTLLSAPAGAGIDLNGIITWTPASEQNNSTNIFRTMVQDDGTPPLSATNVFTVFVNSNPVVVLDSSALVLEGCTPTNNAIDPGETVTMAFSFRNNGTGPATNLLVTLLQTNGVVNPSGPVSYGIVPAGGVVSQPFTFSANSTCGGSINAILQIQDGSLSLGGTNLVFPIGARATSFAENFDSVTAPALPAGWTTTNSGAQPLWRTTNSVVDSAPNAAFCADANNVGSNMLVSPAFLMPINPTQLTFRHLYNFEIGIGTNGFDGGVLEIKIGTNDWADILVAGGSFVTNGYNTSIDTRFSNPLAGRRAWSGTNVSSFLTVIVNLPISAAGQTVQMRWLTGTDVSNGGGGWRVDSITVTSPSCCGNTAPTLLAQSDQTVAELTTLIVTNTAIDSSTPPSGLTYILQNPPSGALIDANGIITWTPSESQGPGSYIITTVVTDNAYPPLSATNSFSVTVLDVNSAPILPDQFDRTIAELSTLIVTNTAIDTDIPANNVSYQLLNPPDGLLITTNGVIFWTPSESQGPGVYTVTTVATDDGSPPLSSTNNFQVTVTEVNTPPNLQPQPNVTIAELTQLVVTNTASDADIPANNLSYQLLNAPAGAAIDGHGVVTWTPSEAQGPSTNLIITVVTDDGTPPLSATNSFVVVVTEVNSAPTLPAITNRTVTANTTLIVTNTASDSDIPTNILSYQLDNPPTGVVIDANGIISWTPNNSQAPSTNTITTIVTDNGIPALSATNSFLVFVTVSQNVTAPVIQSITVSNQIATIVWSSVAGHTYRLQYKNDLSDSTWTDITPDIPATADTTSASDAVGNAQDRFYRVLLLP